MPKFIVQIAETRNFEITVDAADEATASTAAWKIWREAPEVGGYEIDETEDDIVAITEKKD